MAYDPEPLDLDIDQIAYDLRHDLGLSHCCLRDLLNYSFRSVENFELVLSAIAHNDDARESYERFRRSRSWAYGDNALRIIASLVDLELRR